ncbi:transglycosylase SLT domain-containing protein [Nocardia brevicatena]|uniref:transglycosylase SLT domain-containing protein n=1 Tax=Nocardia brevicatena TaxID=37327 RepID=UPI0006883EED|nr:transglycosylase SLT domain-containing protein [Nocardia brevicatena]
MPDNRFHSARTRAASGIAALRGRSRRENFAVAMAAAGLIAVTASSAVSVADNDVAPSRIAMVAEQQAAPAAEQPAAPAAEAAPAPAPASTVEPVAAAAPIPAPGPAPAPAYPDNLEGWIHEALDIMKANDIPGSYEGIKRNILRESSGDPQAINLWDSNAAMGIPSKGLLQVIDPTFAAYHVSGTPFNVWDPVANIVAACNYAAHRYGSMDNVNSAY